MAVIAVVLLQITKDQTRTTVKGEIDNALAQAQQEILSIITNPANCNANFAQLPTTISGSPANMRTLAPANPSPTINKCKISTAAACRTAPVSPYTDYEFRFPVYHATWAAFEWHPDTTKISSRVRISALTYDVQAGPIVTPGPGVGQGDGTLQTLRLNVRFQIRDLPDRTGVVTIKPVDKTFSTIVVVNGSTVVGCPKSSGTTALF